MDKSITQLDQRIIDLHHDYAHHHFDRRKFLEQAAKICGSAAAAAALLPVLDCNYALAETVKADDPRLVTERVTYPGVTGDVKGYIARPKDNAKHAAIVVVHEIGGLNPHTEDIARRLATEGYVALAVDFLSPVGGTPAPGAGGGRGPGAGAPGAGAGGRGAGGAPAAGAAAAAPPAGGGGGGQLANRLDPEQTYANGVAAVKYLRTRADVNGKIGIVGFCWGGRVVQHIAVADPSLTAAVAFYGEPPSLTEAAKLKAPLLMNYADVMLDMNNGGEGILYAQELKKLGKTYDIHFYPGAQHGFNNDTNQARYNEAAAKLAWSRTIAWFKKYLG